MTTIAEKFASRSKLFDRAEAEAERKIAEILVHRKAKDIRFRANVIQRDLQSLSITSEDPKDAGKLNRLVNMTAEEAAADDGLAVQMRGRSHHQGEA
jgi:hypothetical protein